MGPDVQRIFASRQGNRAAALSRLARLGRTLLRLQAGPSRWPPPAVPGQRRVLLHVGLHKTGTTALQRFLSGAAADFQTHGVLYPKSGRSTDSADAHHNIAWQMGGDRRFRSSRGALNDVAAEISSFPGDAIISSEDFESILGTPARFMPMLKHPLLKGHAFTIVFWVRDQASYLESLFFEMLRHRMAQEAVRFGESALACGQIRHDDWTFHFDYASVYAGLLGLPATIVARPYAGLIGSSIVSDFLAFSGLDCASDGAGSQERANSRLSLPEALSLFCERRLGSAPADRSTRCEAFVRLLDGRPVRLSSPLRAALIARFAACNRRLARACGFPTGALAISPLPPAGAIPMEAIFSLSTQCALADFAGHHADMSELPFSRSSADGGSEGRLLHTAWR